MNTTTYFSFALSLCISLISLTAVLVTMKNNVTRLTEREKQQDVRDEAEAREMRDFIILLKSFISTQTEVNRTVELALAAVVNQLRDMEKRTVESATVLSLLTEVLKKSKISGLEVAP